MFNCNCGVVLLMVLGLGCTNNGDAFDFWIFGSAIHVLLCLLLLLLFLWREAECEAESAWCALISEASRHFEKHSSYVEVASV